MRFRSFFRRRRADPFAEGEDPSGVRDVFGRAEVHRFNDRLFIIVRSGAGPGVAAPDGADPHAIGECVQRAVAYSWTHPLRDLPWRVREGGARQAKVAWEVFCRDEAETSPAGYDPEIRISVIESDDGGVQVCSLTSSDLEVVELPPEADAQRIGDAVLRLLAETEPKWPTIRSASLVSLASGGVVVNPHRGSLWAGPVGRLDPDFDDSMLASAIRAALDTSSEEEQDEPEPFPKALAEVGLTDADLAGGVLVSIRETTKGEILVRPSKPVSGGWDPAGIAETSIPDGDPIAVAHAARAAMLEVPTRHRKRGVKTGAAFGSKTAWLAVRDGTSEQVADAIGLTARKRLSWQKGVGASYEDGIFVSPPTSGWILAVGVGWFDDEPDVAALSARLSTEVQYFATHRVIEAHTWERAVEGDRVRRLSHAGESGELEQEGEVTETEDELGLADLDEDAAIDLISEDTVMNVAEGWSLNPQLLDATPTSGSAGTHGRLETA